MSLKPLLSAKQWSFWMRIGSPLFLFSLVLHGLVLFSPLPQVEPLPETPAVDADPRDPENPEEPLQPQAARPQEAIPVVQGNFARSPAADRPPSPPQTAATPEPSPPRPTPQTAPAAPTPTPPSPEPDPPTPDPPIPEPVPTPPPPLEPVPAPPPPSTLEERLRNFASYVFNGSLVKSTETGTQDFVVWYNQINEETWILPGDSKALEPLKVEYPLTECLPTPPAEGSLGIVVNPSGELDRAPEVLASTGYEVLNEKAKEMVAQYALPTVETLTAYGVSVVVDYDPATCQPVGP